MGSFESHYRKIIAFISIDLLALILLDMLRNLFFSYF